MTKSVAIVGHAFRFPGSDTKNLWAQLVNKKDLISEVADDRWSKHAYLHPNRDHPGTSYTFAAGSIGDISGFDATFFGISPREAMQIDPQQRVLLEMSWEALENSGIVPSSIAGSDCGVYIGIASTDYSYRLADDMTAIDPSVATGSTPSIAANRISYALDLRGPSMAIDTACSSSLVAFHQACQSIRSGECSMALAGGISLHLHPYGFVIFSKASMLSRQGRCRVFDSTGDGYVRSEGGGIFVLKDYQQALDDGDPILAVVAASGVNTDGYKSGLTVPRPDAQAALLTDVYQNAGISPEDIDYIEAHGTGTAVGDPVETHAIGMGIGQHRPVGKPIPIGSVKSNLGHLETASGVAGMVKALYSLRHRMVPATIGIKSINPNIRCDEWNISVVREHLKLKPKGTLTIGVNSFGFGGANAHVVLQSHEVAPSPAQIQPVPLENPLPLLVSGQDISACRQAAGQLADFLRQHSGVSLYDVAHTALFHRERMRQRAAIFASDTKQAADLLEQFSEQGDETTQVASDRVSSNNGSIAFVYSGNGSQWLGMGKSLLADAIFRATVEEIDALFIPLGGFSLLQELDSDVNSYASTAIAQPALFAVQVGITRMLAARGVVPGAVTGHSVGEVAAAWACGALSLADAVLVIYERSRLQEKTRGQGQMTAVALGEKSLLSLLAELKLGDGVVLAGSNSPTGSTAAGDVELLDQLEHALAERQIRFKRLPLDYAFHSPAMDCIAQELESVLAGINPKNTEVRFFSTVSGTVLDGVSLNANYWWKNIRQPVLFANAVDGLLDNDSLLFVEIAPHAVMRGYLNEALQARSLDGRVITTGIRDQVSAAQIERAAAQVLACGGELTWDALFPLAGRFVSLPNYPWQHERFWREPSSESQGLLQRTPIHPLLGWPLAQHKLFWENHLDTRLHPVLADHVVGDATVFPGTGFIELALAAAAQYQPKVEWVELEGIEIRTPLLLDGEHASLVRLSIDPSDSRFSIQARDYGHASEWSVHAVGRILPEPQGLRARMLSNLVPPDCKPDFDEQAHTALTMRAGLAYGPSFRCIKHGWFEQDGSILAKLDRPEAIQKDLAKYLLHPALLDCTFQLIIQLLRDEVGHAYHGVYVPVSMGRVSCLRNNSAPSYGRAILVGRTAHSLTASFVLYDAQGEVIARIEEGRFRHVRLKRSNSNILHYLHHYMTPAPLRLAKAQKPAIDFEAVSKATSFLVKHFVDTKLLRTFVEQVDPLLDALCAHFVAESVATAGPVTTETPFLSRLLEMAEQDGLLAAENEEISAADLWRELIAEYPSYSSLIHAIGRVSLRLPEYIADPDARETLFNWQPQLSELLCHTIDPTGRRVLNNALQAIVLSGQKSLKKGRHFKLLEINSGQPVIAGELMPVFDFNAGELLFASTSLSGFEAAEHYKESFPLFETQLLDDDTDYSSPAMRATLAIVTMNFTHIDEADRALRFARKQLAPSGILLLIGYPLSRWMDMVIGACQEDWFTQRSLFSRRFVQNWLSEQGFSDVAIHNLSDQEGGTPYLAIAHTDTSEKDIVTEVSPAQHWLLHTSKHSALSTALLAKLQKHGHMVTCLDYSLKKEKLFDGLLAATQAHGKLTGIVSFHGEEQKSSTSEQLLAQQLARCEALAYLSQASEQARINTKCWLVTCSAHSDSDNNSDAALWGFGRTLANESGELSLHLVDLDESLSGENAVDALAHELMHGDGEREILLGVDGLRLAPRMTADPNPFAVETAVESDNTPTLQLGFDFPGKLSNLKWFGHTRANPNEGEVEVVVHATGLNFRDVMYALGLLPDEAIETGFAGPTLGLEFAGEVLRLGPGVEEYAVGDYVVGFGPSSFANRAITKVSALAKIPAGLSFEAAASIPSAFFTVYYALHHLSRLQPGEKILIHGAAGAVGIAAIQIAQWLGAEVHATVGSEEKRDFVRLLGVEHIYHSRSLSYADEILAATDGHGVDVVLNSLAGEALLRNFHVLRPFGRFLELGKRDFYENSRIGLRPFRNNISYFGIDADQLMNERPDLTRRLFSEVMQLFNDGILSPLPLTLFDARDIVDAFRYMQQARQIGKIVVTYQNGIPAAQQASNLPLRELKLTDDGTWLVTGGLSGFGLKTAQWLADKGVRNLVLVSRSGKITREAEVAIRALKVKGVRVLVRPCNVTNESQLRSLLNHIAEDMPSLRGIVHAAVVIEDGLVRNLDRAQIERVLAPKIMGADLLHRLTIDLPLDYFILFSSATTLFGNPGQSVYVAGNHWMEALARKRRAQGLPATVALWGAIDDAGFLARNEQIKEALQSRMGGSAIPSSVALHTLEQMMLADRSGLGVLELEWNALARFLPTANTSRFRDIARIFGKGEIHDDGGEDIARMLQELNETELLDRFVMMLREEVGAILRLSPERIDPERSLFDIGLDSLMGVELAVAIEGRFSTRLPVMALQENATINKLAARLREQICCNSDVTEETMDKVALSAIRHGAEEINSDGLASIVDSLSKLPSKSMIADDK